MDKSEVEKMIVAERERQSKLVDDQKIVDGCFSIIMSVVICVTVIFLIHTMAKDYHDLKERIHQIEIKLEK